MAEERRSYIIIRPDGLVIHTKPITEDEAWWLRHIYYVVKDAALRARYLEEYGNVIDVHDYLGRLEQLGRDLYYSILGVYEDPEEFAEKVSQLLGRGDLPPGGRQTLEELLDRVEKFLARPVEPGP